MINHWKLGMLGRTDSWTDQSTSVMPEAPGRATGAPCSNQAPTNEESVGSTPVRRQRDVH